MPHKPIAGSWRLGCREFRGLGDGKTVVKFYQIVGPIGEAIGTVAEGYEGIVAFPDLLEACEKALEALAPIGHFSYRADRNAAIGDAYNALRKAIAKAKGELLQATEEK